MGGHRVGSLVLDQLTADPQSPVDGEIWQRFDEGVAKLFTDGVGHRVAGFDGVPVFVFQPGGSVGGNVYTDWATLYAELSEYDGGKDLIFDNTYGTPQVPAGTWDMTGVTWRGLGSTSVTVQVLDGAIITGLRSFADRIQVTSLATTTSPVSDLGNGDILLLTGGSSIRALGVGVVPFIQVTGGSFSVVYVYLSEQSSILSGGAPAIDLSVSGKYLYMYLGKFANVAANSLSGVVGTVVYGLRVSTSARFSLTHSSHSGTIAEYNYCSGKNVAFVPGASGLTSTNVQDAVIELAGSVDTATDKAIVAMTTTGGQVIGAVAANLILDTAMSQTDTSKLEWDTTNHELLVKMDGFLVVSGGVSYQETVGARNIVAAMIEVWTGGPSWNLWGGSGGFCYTRYPTANGHLGTVDVRAMIPVQNGDKIKIPVWREGGTGTMGVYSKMTGIQAMLLGV